MRSDENGMIMLKEDPRQFVIETPPGVAASIEQV
jgi:hypothetical protein